ncbi:MAG: branched-chain amino acid ABC transporter permease [Betaproteobacteria bacterium]|nr:AzlC family ABC transporter permease [Pseudomonadota bacterium]NBO12275.1 branched-chain amino acid ABC transporter permease [Betaproteobacteria bacterium]NBO44126.1 branched-chain amino acid ABC transporter permease [Betaproteobacteria bacterium]NBP09903.1 branched-chain amino acid ABC transporter permease [Betaproteobacteria bacterium]NBP61666.1 branched-chain amino acid ABC transporter permease [Betaproteobacteria bacterium]
MFLRKSYYQHPSFRAGLNDMAAIVPGIAAWGLMTGVAMAKSGMPWSESVLMALIVFAGSAQLAAIPLFAADAPMWVILATSFCVNLRFLVFSAHLREYMMMLPRAERMLSGYLTADLTYVQFVQRFAQGPGADRERMLEQQAYLAAHGGLNWLSWVLSNLAGVFLASWIPQHWGLGFAGMLGLMGIGLSLLSGQQNLGHAMRLLAAVSAAVVAVLAVSLPLKLNIVVAIVAAVALCLIVEPALAARQRREA